MEQKLLIQVISTTLILTSTLNASTVSNSQLNPPEESAPHFMQRGSYKEPESCTNTSAVLTQIDATHARVGLDALLGHEGARRVDTESTPTETPCGPSFLTLASATLGQVEAQNEKAGLERHGARLNCLDGEEPNC